MEWTMTTLMHGVSKQWSNLTSTATCFPLEVARRVTECGSIASCLVCKEAGDTMVICRQYTHRTQQVIRIIYKIRRTKNGNQFSLHNEHYYYYFVWMTMPTCPSVPSAVTMVTSADVSTDSLAGRVSKLPSCVTMVIVLPAACNDRFRSL